MVPVFEVKLVKFIDYLFSSTKPVSYRILNSVKVSPVTKTQNKAAPISFSFDNSLLLEQYS